MFQNQIDLMLTNDFPFSQIVRPKCKIKKIKPLDAHSLSQTRLVVMKRFIAVHRKPSSLPSVRFTIHTHGCSVRSHVQPSACILLSFIKTNTKSDLISLCLISDNTGV